jgi:uncharacterized protein (TIGR03067 family)
MHKPALLIVAGCSLIAADAKDGEVKKELRKLQGTWVLIAGEMDGMRIPAKHVKKSRITWNGKEVTLTTPHQSKTPFKGTVTVDPRKKEMTRVRASGPGAGKTMHAIYEFLSDDQYRVCFPPGGKKRPTKYATKPGSGQFLHVWNRQKK